MNYVELFVFLLVSWTAVLLIRSLQGPTTLTNPHGVQRQANRVRLQVQKFRGRAVWAEMPAPTQRHQLPVPMAQADTIQWY